MHLILCYPTGRRVDALLLAAGRDRLRLAVPHRNETLELRLEDGGWTSDAGIAVEIESVVWDGTTSLPAFAMTAGSRTLYAIS